MNKFVTAFLFIAFSAVRLTAQNMNVDPRKTQKVAAAEFFISHFYVDSLSEDKVIDDAITGMLKSLDPHSAYIKAKDVERSTERLNGSFEGIGVQFNIVEDTLVVVQPVSGGPSERKGILAGDRFVTVNDTAIAGVKMSREEIMRRLRGPKGSKVRIGVKREGVRGINEFVITRDKIPVNTLDASYMVDDHVGYVRLSSFGMTTHQEFVDAVNRLKAQGMRDLVLDLQGNGGGYLSAAVDIANEFLPAGDLIVYTDGRSTPRQEFRAQGNGMLREGRVVVLVDSYTASAAEIVSGAVQDNDRGVIVGRRTFGKGLVQRPFELPDHSVIRLTVSHYYSPSGRCIQKPYKLGQQKDYEDDIAHRLKTQELTRDVSVPLSEQSDSIDRELHRELFPDSLSFRTAHQGRTVYAGGGIMPDIYVTLDTAQLTPLYRQLSVKGCIINTSLKYLDKHRKPLRKTYRDFEAFRRSFLVPDDMLAQLRTEAAHSGVDIKEDEWEQTLPMLRSQLKALLARDLWDMSEYYQLINPLDRIYAKGLEVVHNFSNDF